MVLSLRAKDRYVFKLLVLKGASDIVVKSFISLGHRLTLLPGF